MERSFTLVLLVGSVVVVVSRASPAAQGYGGAPVVTAYRPAPTPAPTYNNLQPQRTCPPRYTTTTVYSQIYVTETKSVLQYTTQYQTQYQTKYQTQYKTQYVTKREEVPVYVTKTQAQIVTKTEHATGYVTRTATSYVTATVKQPVTQSCLPAGGYSSGSTSGATGYSSGSTSGTGSGGYGIIDAGAPGGFDVRTGSTGTSRAPDINWEWSS